ncbi:hypothetical protein [Candidatus Foliamicus sp.]
MTAPLAWLINTNVVSEMMRPRPEPRVSAFLDSIAGETTIIFRDSAFTDDVAKTNLVETLK